LRLAAGYIAVFAESFGDRHKECRGLFVLPRGGAAGTRSLEARNRRGPEIEKIEEREMGSERR